MRSRPTPVCNLKNWRVRMTSIRSVGLAYRALAVMTNDRIVCTGSAITLDTAVSSDRRSHAFLKGSPSIECVEDGRGARTLARLVGTPANPVSRQVTKRPDEWAFPTASISARSTTSGAAPGRARDPPAPDLRPHPHCSLRCKRGAAMSTRTMRQDVLQSGVLPFFHTAQNSA